MTAYYNEIDPYAAQWLRNLIAAGHIAPGDVDERSIHDVRPADLAGYTQCHFFAGIGVWSHALRRAGWPDDRPVWTGSCPCQPFSSAGLARGFTDERHLWPIFHFLIEECRPPVVFGEQVASKDGLAWLDLVQADMEGTGYAFAAVDLCAAGIGAPHIRQRLWFVGELADAGLPEPQGRIRVAEGLQHRAGDARSELAPRGTPSRMDNANNKGLEGLGRGHQAPGGGTGSLRSVAEAGEPCGLEHAGSIGRNGRETAPPGHDDDRAASERAQGEHGLGIASAHRLHQHGAGPTNGHWRDADWLFCRDGKWRPVEPGTFPLAHGAASRVGRLRAYGNAIVAGAAEAVIGAYMEARL